MTRRAYRLGKRAESQQETRRRITEATIELHGTVGPSRTTVADIARKAGVQRLTVYTHFPDLTSLFAACTSHWVLQHPLPDPAGWMGEPQPQRRLATALSTLYGYYAEHRQMFANWLRDAEIIPELKPFAEAGYYGFITQVRDVTLADLDLGEGAQAAFLVALHFETWRLLVERQALSAEEAAELMARSVLAVSSPAQRISMD
jgi:AcrR family transcriptional regulator